MTISAETQKLVTRLIPAGPRDAGLDEAEPGMAWLASAHLLANEAEPLLRPAGFSDEQILSWAEAYLTAEHSGDLDTFIAWIAVQEYRLRNE